MDTGGDGDSAAPQTTSGSTPARAGRQPRLRAAPDYTIAYGEPRTRPRVSTRCSRRAIVSGGRSPRRGGPPTRAGAGARGRPRGPSRPRACSLGRRRKTGSRPRPRFRAGLVRAGCAGFRSHPGRGRRALGPLPAALRAPAARGRRAAWAGRHGGVEASSRGTPDACAVERPVDPVRERGAPCLLDEPAWWSTRIRSAARTVASRWRCIEVRRAGSSRARPGCAARSRSRPTGALVEDEHGGIEGERAGEEEHPPFGREVQPLPAPVSNPPGARRSGRRRPSRGADAPDRPRGRRATGSPPTVPANRKWS